jgi:prohibitin 1
MAAQFFNRISQLGVGVALTAGVINSALYNGGLFYCFYY